MRISTYDRYQQDPIFNGVVDTLYMMLETDNNYSGRQYTPTEMREAAMLACEMYEARHIRPILITKEAGDSMLAALTYADTAKMGEPLRTATGANLVLENRPSPYDVSGMKKDAEESKKNDKAHR